MFMHLSGNSMTRVYKKSHIMKAIENCNHGFIQFCNLSEWLLYLMPNHKPNKQADETQTMRQREQLRGVSWQYSSRTFSNQVSMGFSMKFFMIMLWYLILFHTFSCYTLHSKAKAALFSKTVQLAEKVLYAWATFLPVLLRPFQISSTSSLHK